MSLIAFDIVYKKKTDKDAFKLVGDSEIHQLKLMICGKYRIYDMSKLYIYYKGELLNNNDKDKLKEVFRNRKIKLEIQDKPTLKIIPQAFKYYCKCKNGATYVCDKCDEYVCDLCIKKKKHITHVNKMVKIKDYSAYIKNNLKELASEIDYKIINDEAYHFFPYWNYDLTNEICSINECYEFIKKEIEDIKQIQIEYLVNLCNYNSYSTLKNDIDNLMKEFTNLNVNDEGEKMCQERKRIINESRGIIEKFTEMKNELILYTNVIKDVQTFNQVMLKEVKDKFSYIKKKYYSYTTSNATINYNSNSALGHNYSRSQVDMKKPLNSSQSMLSNSVILDSSNINNTANRNKRVQSQHNLSTTLNNQNNTIIMQNDKDKLIFKLKDQRKVIIFSLTSQTFKEKIFTDSSGFKTNITNEADITELNAKGKLYILTGKKYNKLYYYDFPSNSINFISNTLYPHYYGSLIYCIKNNSIYLLSGNNQPKCEILRLDDNQKKTWTALPSLNEERQEFAAMSFNEYIYVFFGFSPKKGINLSSIERMSCETNAQFDIIYINEQITLSSLACARYIDEEDDDEKNEILLIGGFDGKNYVDSSLVFNADEMKIRDCDIVIPNINKHSQFLFQKESMFIDVDNGVQIAFDMKANVHLVSKESYELFSEVI